MATFQGIGTASIKTDDNFKLEAVFNALGLKSKQCFERVLPAGTHDLSAQFADFTTIRGILITAEDSDFTFTLDTTNFSPRKHKIVFLEVADTGAQTLSITLTGQSLVKMLVVGD